MKVKLILTLVAIAVVTSLVSTSTQVEAAGRRGYIMRDSNGQGIFARLMEMERRKNEWLFGR
jgi:hypothetical protein